MKIIKTGLFLSLFSLILLNCKTVAQSKNIISINYTNTYGRGGMTSITATKDSLETTGRGGRVPDFPNFKKKIDPKDWENLVSSIDVNTLEQTKNGGRRGVYDGNDEIIYIITADKEYEFYNVPKDTAGYTKLEKLKEKINSLFSQYK